MVFDFESLKPRLAEIFQHLHRQPEISWEEFETRNYTAALLRDLGCEIREIPGCAGFVADLGSGTPTVALRADMDALWQEVDGQYQANHSCGHDAHMTMVLGVSMVLAASEIVKTHGVRFLFQPAEEKGLGALKMMEHQALDGVDLLFGVHLRPHQEVARGFAAPAILHGAATFLAGEIVGEDAHGARPHLSANAIEVGAALIRGYQDIRLNPMVPYSVKMTRFQAGGQSSNIIPGKAVFSLDLRAQTNEQMEELVTRVERVTKAHADLSGVVISLTRKSTTAAAEVHPRAQALMAEAICDAWGKQRLVPPTVTSGGDDFHFYTLKKPHLKATMLGLGCGLKPGLHHPHMTFDHEALIDGTRILTTVVQKALQMR